MKDIFIEGTFEDAEQFEEAADYFFDLQCNYNLQDCGMSGRFIGYHWYYDGDAELNVYVK